MDIFNPSERQQIIPPPPPPSSTSATPTNTASTNTTSPSVSTSNATTSAARNNITVTIDTKQMQNELERRQQELEAKAAELAAREEALRQGGEFGRQHNWPPLPSFCPIKPCFFQDINIDIRPEFQRTVQLGYHLWVAFVFALILNLFGSLLALIYKLDGAGENFLYGLMTLLFLAPLSYVSWFRPLYKAFKNDSSFNFMVYFFVFFMKIMIVGFWALAGLTYAFKNTSASIFPLLVLYLVAATWVMYIVASTLYLLRVHAIYRSSGASMAKARNEFTHGIISNQYVQQTVANATLQTANQAYQTTNSGGQPNVR